MALILVGFGESLAAPEVVWSLQEAGHDVVALVRVGRRAPVRRLKGLRTVEIPAPERSAEDCVAALRRLGAAGSFDVAMPLDDSAVWVMDAAGLDVHVPVAGATGEQAAFALDKRRQLDAARAAGMSVAPTVEHESITAAAAEQASFPCFVKPALAVAVSGGRLVRGRGWRCETREDLQRAARKGGEGPVLAQPVLDGTGEGMFGLVRDGVATAWSAHRRIRMMNPEGSGSSACASRPVDDDLRGSVERLLVAAGWSGMFMVELLRDAAGRPWFMEFNGRPWGSLALARRRGGEYPAWAADHVLGTAAPLPPSLDGPPLVCRHLGRELVHLLYAMRGPGGARPINWPTRREALQGVFGVSPRDGLYNARAGQRRFLALDTWHTVREALR